MKQKLAMIGFTALLTVSSSAVLADDDKRWKSRQYDDRGYSQRDYDDRRYSQRDYDDRAKVSHVQPVYREVRVSTPVRECYESQDSHRQNQNSYTGTIAGGIIGGVLGNQLGGGNGKTVMTVAGTLLGGSVGRDIGQRSNNYDNRDPYREQCHTRYRDRYEREIEGYEVSYRYKNRDYTTFMDHHPGKFVPVDVSARPSRRFY